MKASDFRKQAWLALSGKWGIAILASIIASIFGGTAAITIIPSVEFKVNFNTSIPSENELMQAFDPSKIEAWQILVVLAVVFTILFIILTISIISSAITFCIASTVEVGYEGFNVDLIDNKKLSIARLFTSFRFFGKALLANLIRQIFITLWSLLFIIPGIIAQYRYSMVPFIIADHPEFTAKDALDYSKMIMIGNKWRLFCLMFSFFGWNILCILTFGILNFWISPYKHAAIAAFYRSIVPQMKSEDTDSTKVAESESDKEATDTPEEVADEITYEIKEATEEASVDNNDNAPEETEIVQDESAEASETIPVNE